MQHSSFFKIRKAQKYSFLHIMHKVLLLIQSYLDFILELFSVYRIEQVSAKRMINCKVRKEEQYRKRL
jgi:hypothetical protein